jgi:hypothetical protein
VKSENYNLLHVIEVGTDGVPYSPFPLDNYGTFTLIEKDDLHWVEKLDLRMSRTGPTRTPYVYFPENGKEVLLHRRIVNCSKQFSNGKRCLVDYKNRNTLDNRKINLRICGSSENVWNACKPKKNNSTSKYKGVSFNAVYLLPWRARITVNNKCLYIGKFATEKEAAEAYNNAARFYHGEFARLNDVA